ncbi:MAG: DeoR/GlpR transcriptional regulator [Gorillibacterium sp.]|nr:DeoR/GlpR transcriptional regulator [Gorillibacterium sp.]
MLSYQRKQAIIEYMETNGAISISELSELLTVSDMTIRRDLKLLEMEGLVKRTHGGAIRTQVTPHELRFEEKKGFQQERKVRIAKFAVEHFVSDNSVILLEGGTTVSCMANSLHPFRNLTVVTNGLNTLAILKRMTPYSSILSSGGMLRDISHTFVGPLAEQFFAQIHGTHAFFSASGYTREQGFTDPNMLECQVKKAMRRAAKRSIMLIDSTKFGNLALLTTFLLKEMDVVITDDGAPQDVLEHLQDSGIQVHVV